ncbi:hypothetical protein GCM10023188_27720 [Pontibacter saemangeumensis]|uniref:IPT/TIG domain-containing protein n=1 Tax=Pontibacter saemangeumensis TaxID=1084525 RepID=A0ABP8LSE7_9BACT
MIYENASFGAKVVLVRIRNGVKQEVGATQAVQSRGIISLEAGEELMALDKITIYQKTDTDSSHEQPDAVEVQSSGKDINPPQVLTHLYHCSRGFTLGGMRPGTKVEALEDNTAIGQGEAIDGTAFIQINEFGLPLPGAVLTARQHVCPKPPPPNNAPEWIVDTSLPAVEALPTQVPTGGQLPAPNITKGVTACSRAVEVTDVIPGAEVFIEDANAAWWAWVGPSEQTTVTVRLPVPLEEGRQVKVRQEVGMRCEYHPEVRQLTVGPPESLEKPRLWQIDCHSLAFVHVAELKPEADLEFEVTFQGVTTIYRGQATNKIGYVPAPIMPEGATVRVRQGECGHWSDWSEPRTTAVFAGPVQKPRITSELFHCQRSVPVENVFPLAGIVRVVSNALGTIAQSTVSSDIMSIQVAPSLIAGHEIRVEHELCGMLETSDMKRVNPLAHISPGKVEGPLFDGDTSVRVKDVTANAYVELWDQSHRIHSGYAPFSSDGKATVTFSDFGKLHAGQHIYMKFWYCGHYGRNEGLPVAFHAPVLSQIIPDSALVGSSAITLTAKGSYFRQGAVLRWGGQNRTTTFVSGSEVTAQIGASDLASARSLPVLVVNTDGKMTGSLQFKVEAPPPPPPPPASLKLDMSVSLGAMGTIRINRATFQVTPSHTNVMETYAGVVAANGVSAKALFEKSNYPNGTYYVAVQEVEFTYTDPGTATPVKTTTLSGPWDQPSQGRAFSLVAGVPIAANFSVMLDNLNPTRFLIA